MFNNKELILLNRNLYFYTKSGYNIEKTLYIISKQENISDKIKKNIEEVLKKLIGGKSIYTSFKEVNCMPSYMLQLVKLGEDSGSLSEIFEKSWKYYEEKLKKKKELLNIITYPIILLITTIVIFLGIIFYFVPLINESLGSLNSNGNSSLDNLLKLNFFLKAYGPYIICLLLISLLFLIRCIIKKNKIYYLILNKLFGVKKIYRKIFNINFLNSLKMLVENGLTLINSLNIIISLEKDPYIKKSLDNCFKSMMNGKSLYLSLKEINLFSKEALNIINMGEETGSLEESLNNANYIEEQEFKVFINKVLGMLQPSVILLLGIFIFKIIYSILIPVVDTMGGIK